MMLTTDREYNARRELSSSGTLRSNNKTIHRRLSKQHWDEQKKGKEKTIWKNVKDNLIDLLANNVIKHDTTLWSTWKVMQTFQAQ